jgi:hypothetical protein
MGDLKKNPNLLPKEWGRFAAAMSFAGVRSASQIFGSGAGNGPRTRDTELGKLVLYQLSYARFGFFISKREEFVKGFSAHAPGRATFGPRRDHLDIAPRRSYSDDV